MSRPQSGPPLVVPGLAFAALSIAGVVAGAGAPRPGADPAEILAYNAAHPSLLRVAAVLSFGASVPLAIWSATAYRRLRGWGVTAPGSAIALAGGLLAAAMAAVSGLVTWVSSRATSDGAADLAAALRDLTFITGGPGFVVYFGLLLAGVCVPMLLLDIRRPLAVAGLVIAAFSEVSTVVILTMGAAFTLPVGRFGGLVWLVLASVLLPLARPRARSDSDVAGVRGAGAPAPAPES
jgi:hypothetical protein